VWIHWQTASQHSFGYSETQESYHTGHKGMRTSDLTCTDYGEGKGQSTRILIKRIASVCLWLHTWACSFRNFSGQIRSHATATTYHKSPPLVLWHLSPVSTHVTRTPGQVWSRWFSPADAKQGVFSQSPSPVAVTQEALSFHYPAFPPSASQPDRGFTGIPLRNHHRASALWINGTCCKHYTLQHPSHAAPSHLPITHRWAHRRHTRRGPRLL